MTAIPGLLALFVASFPAPRQDEIVLASYDLRSVLPRWDASTTWSHALVVPPAVIPFRTEIPSADDLEHAELAGYELLDLLTQVLGDELRREGRELLLEGTRLSVLAPGAVQEQVRSVLATLEQALAGTCTLQVDVLSFLEGDAQEAAPASVVEAEEASRLVTTLLARGAQHRQFQVQLAAGRTASLDARRHVPFVFDYDVEIAQESLIFAPIVLETWEGTRLLLRGVPAEGGMALSLLLMRSDLLGELRERPLGLRGMLSHEGAAKADIVDGPEALHLPDVLMRGLAFDTTLPQGKALVLTLESELPGASSHELVLLRQLGSAPPAYVAQVLPGTSKSLIAMNAELFRRPRFHADPTPWEGGETTTSLNPWVVATLEAEPSSFLLDWLKARFSVWRRLGPWVLIVTDPAWDRDAARELERLMKARRGDGRVLGVGVDLYVQGRENDRPVRMRIPMLEGTEAGFVLARASTAVTGFSVEVAQEAAVSDPVVSPVFGGLALALSVGTRSGPTLPLETTGMAQFLDQAPASFDLRYLLMGAIDRPEPRVLRFDERLNVPQGEGQTARASIGSRSDRADQPGLLVEISVR